MKAKPAHAEAGGEKVPLWIISFADMITLLLSFFVMLQTMAHSRDGMLFGIAQDSFRRSIAGMGIPDLIYGRKPLTNFDYRKIKYPTDDTPSLEGQNPTPQRVIDAQDDEVRDLFADIQRMMESTSFDTSEKLLNTVNTPLRFAENSAALGEEAQTYLSDLARDLQQGMGEQTVKVYVVGAARDASRDSGFLAARRAAAVEQFLRQCLREQVARGRWEVLSLSTVAGSVWNPKPDATITPPPITINIMGRKN